MLDRREFIARALAAAGLLFVFEDEADADRPGRHVRRARRRHRRRVRRRIRRRIRRRVAWRRHHGRRVLVVPLALAVGWELAIDKRVVVVHEVKKVEVEKQPVEVVVVEEAGKTEEIEIVREDTAGNTKELDGTELPESDTTTPSRTVEVEEEVEEDEE